MASDSVQTWLSLFPFLVSVLSFLSDYLKAVNYCLQNYKKDCKGIHDQYSRKTVFSIKPLAHK